MPGPVSDSYDPEWGTAERGAAIAEELSILHGLLSAILDNKPPMYILDLVDSKLPRPITATLTERDWRLLRFALERAGESL